MTETLFWSETYKLQLDLNADLMKSKTFLTANSFVPVAVCLLLFACLYVVDGQHNHGPSANEPTVAVAELPPPPLMKDIGTASVKVTTKSAEAQKYFDQGLNLLHAFWDTESYRAFREAARLDPDCAMAWWGIYTALGQNSQEMSGERASALKRAVELMPTASDHEQYYIRAILLLAEQGKGRPAWVSEIEALIDRYPDDIEAQLLLANSLASSPSSYTPSGRPASGKMYGRAILQNILQKYPDNVAANHYWIHAVENSPRPEDALASADKLGKLAPNAGHLIHMPGHIYYRLGMYERARAAFLASHEFDLKYMRENNIRPIDNWNYTHNLDYLVANCAEEGRYQEAARYARILAEVPSDNERLKSTGLGYLLYGGYTALTRLQMRFGMWDEAVKTAQASLRNDPPQTLSEKFQMGIINYLKGMSAVEKGDAAEAENNAAKLETLITELSAVKIQQSSDWYFSYASKILPVHLLDLRGSILSVQGKHEDAFKLLNEAIEKERDLGYWEPPHYTRPVLESLAAAYNRAGKFAEAVNAFERSLKLRPNSGFALLGIARAYAKAADKPRAVAAYQRFRKAWTNADKELPQLREAEKGLK